VSQVRPTTAIVDLDALTHNFGLVRARVPSRTGVLAAVKGDAYGHGAVSCSLALEAAGADWFGVALVEEGQELRSAGVTRPILCMGGLGPAGARSALRHGLTPVISSIEDAEEVDRAAESRQEAHGVHLKVDTGMGRLGVPMHEWGAFLDRIASLRWVRVDGICSHLAGSEPNGGARTAEQERRLQTAVVDARARGVVPSMVHLANSVGIIHHPATHLDLVRPGLMLYGVDPTGPQGVLDLQPVMAVHTRVLMVRDLPAGVGVSYGGTWTTSRPTRMATLPVGYADGYPRALSNKAQVLIHGHLAPICGQVCMDLCMVDVTDVPNTVTAGDEVVLLGRQGEVEINAWDLARWADTIPYEILAGFSQRIPRVYQPF
jgi:alanine racemase